MSSTPNNEEQESKESSSAAAPAAASSSSGQQQKQQPNNDDEKENEKEKKNEKEEEEEESHDEWTVLSKTYTSSFVPAFKPIYESVKDYIVKQLLDDNDNKEVDDNHYRILDFGCGPGEPSITLATAATTKTKTETNNLNLNLNLHVVGVDSTKSMLDIANQRWKDTTTTTTCNSKEDEVSFHYIRRDCPGTEIGSAIIKQQQQQQQQQQLFDNNDNNIARKNFDFVVSTFVLHYVDFQRRVELTKAFMYDLKASQVLYVTWGEQSNVPFLNAIKTFGSWKRNNPSAQDICNIEIDLEDNHDDTIIDSGGGGNPKSPRGSFTMCRYETFQGIVSEINNDQEENVVAVVMKSFEIKKIPIKFPNVMTLLQFLPFPTFSKDDCKAMMKLLLHWKEQNNNNNNEDGKSCKISFFDSRDGKSVDQLPSLDDDSNELLYPNIEICFETEVVFCLLSKGESLSTTSSSRGNSSRSKESPPHAVDNGDDVDDETANNNNSNNNKKQKT